MLTYRNKVYTTLFCILCFSSVDADFLDDLYKDFRLSDSNVKDNINKESRRAVNSEDWQGRWMPPHPDEPTPPPKVFPPSEKKNGENGPSMIQMGIDDACDNGKINLTVDWNNSPENHTCYDNKKLVPDYRTHAQQYCEQVPKRYVAIHKCMNESIEYDDNLPMYGTHRPVWPKYGEYKFLPRQRWLHSLEHGAVVMLYHPCANPLEVKTLRNLVTGCLRRYVISPYNLLDEKRPFALLTWGCRLTMSYVQPKVVVRFIKQKALRGPEQIPRDGDYDFGLTSKAETVSDFNDSTLCPKL